MLLNFQYILEKKRVAFHESDVDGIIMLCNRFC